MPTRTRRKKPPEPVLPLASEAEVLAGVLAALRLYGVDASRQNTGGMTDRRGQYVAFGERGNADVTATLGPSFGEAAGRRLEIETKAEGFRPEALSGKKREHFDRQLERLKRTNESGAYGVWVTDPAQIIHALERIKQGWYIIFIGDYPFLDDGKEE